MVRRMIDAAYASKTPGLIAVMLDWAKAFDRIRVDSMIAALRRFGAHQSFNKIEKLFPLYIEVFCIERTE